MSYTTNVPSPTFGATGFAAPLESAILAGAWADLQAAFGGVLNQTTSSGSQTNPTPQGQLSQSLAAIIGAVNDLFLLYTNLVDPAMSFGRMQDAIGRIYYIERIAQTYTNGAINCIGLVGTAIPVGALIQDVNGNQYAATAAGAIGSSGVVPINFACTVAGPIACAAGNLNSANGAEIVQQIPGWDAIANPAALTEGSYQETPQQFELRRSQSTATNGAGFVSAIRGAILSLPGVIDAYVIENPTSSVETIGGVSLLPNSLYVCVSGGTASAIAQAIWTKKNPGCVYNGNQSFTVYDTQSGYLTPYPSYTVKWFNAAALPFVVSVNLANNSNVPSNALALVQNCVVAAFAGQDIIGYNSSGSALYGPRARIGATYFASRLYESVALLWTNVNIISITLGSTNVSAASFTASISATTMTVTGVTAGTLAPGQSLLDASGNVLPGTTIVSQSSGTAGGVGAYVVSLPQVMTSEVLYGVTATSNDVSVNINQIPTVSAANVSLTLT